MCEFLQNFESAYSIVCLAFLFCAPRLFIYCIQYKNSETLQSADSVRCVITLCSII